MTGPAPERRGPIRRTGPLGPRPPFRVLAATLGLPLFGFALFLGYQWIAGDLRRATEPLLPTAPPLLERAATIAVPPTTPAPPLPTPPAGRIALILDDVGYDPAAAREAAELGTVLNFAVIPGTPFAEPSAVWLAARGFEILCHLPMEPEGFPAVFPGEGAILRSMPDAEIRSRTRAMFRSIPHAKGINNHMGSSATTDSRVMRAVLDAVREEGAFFVDSRTTSKSVSLALARRLGVRSTARDVFLDDDADEAAIRRQIEELARAASKDGIAVGIGHLYPSTLRVLREEIPRLEARGYRFVPISEAVR